MGIFKMNLFILFLISHAESLPEKILAIDITKHECSTSIPGQCDNEIKILDPDHRRNDYSGTYRRDPEYTDEQKQSFWTELKQDLELVKFLQAENLPIPAGPDPDLWRASWSHTEKPYQLIFNTILSRWTINDLSLGNELAWSDTIEGGVCPEPMVADGGSGFKIACLEYCIKEASQNSSSLIDEPSCVFNLPVERRPRWLSSGIIDTNKRWYAARNAGNILQEHEHWELRRQFQSFEQSRCRELDRHPQSLQSSRCMKILDNDEFNRWNRLKEDVSGNFITNYTHNSMESLLLNKCNHEKYEITVMMSSYLWSGTNDKIEIRLYKYGDPMTDWLELKTPMHVDFNQLSFNIFCINPSFIGSGLKPTKIGIRKSGSDDMKIDSITIREPGKSLDNERAFFDIDQWIRTNDEFIFDKWDPFNGFHYRFHNGINYGNRQ